MLKLFALPKVLLIPTETLHFDWYGYILGDLVLIHPRHLLYKR